MRIEPRIDEVVNGTRGMLRGIEAALDAECLVSAVALMFSTVDSLAALGRPIEQQSTTGKVFQEWAIKYLKPAESLACDATDLWAARCGVLHTYSSESDLERKGEARPLVYEWRAGPRADAIAALPQNAVVITVESLHEAVRTAVKTFLVDSEMDPETRKRVCHHLPSLLCYAPWPRMEVSVAA